MAADGRTILGSLSVRRLDDGTLRRLKLQAASHGVSMEEEARRILKDAVSTREGLGDLMVRIFASSHGKTDFEVAPREHAEPLEFE